MAETNAQKCIILGDSTTLAYSRKGGKRSGKFLAIEGVTE